MNRRFYDFDDVTCDINYRWLQPPQVAYFVTTVDRQGNSNSTPVTLGTVVAAALPEGDIKAEFYFTFSLGKTHRRNPGNEIEVRHGFFNLRDVPECVISYIGHHLERESFVAGLPVPRGISEIEVAGLTPLPSKKVSPPGIAECPVNMEARIISSQQIGTYYQLYLARIVATSVSADYLAKDDGLGIFGIDPVFEVAIERGEDGTGDARLSYGRLDRGSVRRSGDGMGSSPDWIGSFQSWITSEVKRGRLARDEAEEILDLNRRWQKNRNPKENSAVKIKLTQKLTALCGKGDTG